MKSSISVYASFKDPAARVYTLQEYDTFIFRELHAEYMVHFNYFVESGLSKELLKRKWIIPFEEIKNSEGNKVLKAEKIPFVSFPYEWTFSQWKEATLLTLKIQFQALKFGMTLKDATPFNIVFRGTRPLLVDLSSFEIYKEGTPWQAYKQFCESLYLPLLLVRYFDDLGNAVFLKNFNGIPLKKGLALLPSKAFFNLNTLYSLVLPAGINPDTAKKRTSSFLTKKRSLEFAEQLFTNINKLFLSAKKTKWNAYYFNDTDAQYLREKEEIILNWFSHNYLACTLIDFGCNTGNFSVLLHNHVHKVLAFDADIRSVDMLYSECRKKNIENIYCFTADLSQPTPSVGWNNFERPALIERLTPGVGLALAIVHHLAISNYISFSMMADFFARSCAELVIEFVPKEDEKVKLLLAEREAIFDWYSQGNFETAFGEKFSLKRKHTFSNGRIVFHFILRA